MGATQRFWPSFISPLSARILAIMLLPLALFFIGLFSIDQYRSVLVRAEFDALERQGMTLARSQALAEADSQCSARRAFPSPRVLPPHGGAPLFSSAPVGEPVSI